jgi:hypothetical protein
MRRYAVKTRFAFNGTFFIAARNKGEAKEFVEKQCGLVLGGNIHSTLPGDGVDWDFLIHPEKAVGRVNVSPLSMMSSAMRTCLSVMGISISFVTRTMPEDSFLSP